MWTHGGSLLKMHTILSVLVYHFDLHLRILENLWCFRSPEILSNDLGNIRHDPVSQVKVTSPEEFNQFGKAFSPLPI